MNWPEVKAWRRDARQRMLAARAAMPISVREDLTRRLIERLRPVLQDRTAPISFYWPIKAEPDLKPLMRELDAAGIEVCLPVCIKLGEPLRFRPWTKGAKMERGFWDIPVPADPTEIEPKTLIAPIVGYASGYRLGYGGGFFDRTLAKFSDSAAIGIGFSMFRLETIYPQPHDIPMSTIITETGMVGAEAAAPASEVCYLQESDPIYAGFDTPAETAQKLAALIGRLPPERGALLDYVLWRLGDAPTAPRAATESPLALLDRILPRIRDDALHAALTALRASIVATAGGGN